MKMGDVYKGAFLKADDLKTAAGKYGTLLLTIAGCRTGNFDDGTEQRVAGFEEDDRELGLNKTNFAAIVEITGEEDDDNWAGTQIELYVDTNVLYKGKKVPAIRVRAPQAAAAKPAATAAPARAATAKPAPAAAEPPPDDVPAEPTLDGVKDKASAWAYFRDKLTAEGKTIPEVTAQWRSTIKASGKSEGEFTADDWKNTAEAADLPF